MHSVLSLSLFLSFAKLVVSFLFFLLTGLFPSFFSQVLCELQVALMERAVTLRPDVTRNAMSTEYRSMSSSATYRDLRDWLIFRDYMNGLEYVVQVFEHLRRGLESWGRQGGSRRRATRRRLAHFRKTERPDLETISISSWTETRRLIQNAPFS